MRNVFLVLIGVGLGSFVLGGGSAVAAPGAKPAIAADGGVIAAHYRGRGYYGGSYGHFPRSYSRGYYGGSYGRGYYGGSYGYYPRYNGYNYRRW